MDHFATDFDRVRRALDIEDGPHFGGGAFTDTDDRGRRGYYFYRDKKQIFLGYTAEEAIRTYRAKYARGPAR